MKIFRFFACLLIAVMLGTTFAGIGGGVAFAAVSLIPKGVPAGALSAELIPEVWTKEFIKRFNHIDQGTFLEGISDYSAMVRDGNIIHLIDFGCDPDVLVNNKEYPIPVQDMTNVDKTLTLDKLQTKATPVSDDVVNDVKAEFMPAVIDAHRIQLEEYRLDKAIYNFAPSKNADKTPVLTTTGGKETLADGTRLRFSREDVVSLKLKFDQLQVPAAGRRLVLCPQHVADLLMVDQAFAQQYYNYSTGAIAKMYGFDIYEFVNMPKYTSAGNKKAYGASAASGDQEASVAFHVSRVSKATGERKQYLSRAETDPLYQRNLYNVREYFLALPKKDEAIAAIYSGVKSA